MSDRSVNCPAVARLLDLVDADARLDRVALAAHLDACPACAAEHADAAWMVAAKAAAPDGPRPRVGWPAQLPKLGAVALVVAGLLFAFGHGAAAERVADRPAIAITAPRATGHHDGGAAPLRFLPTELDSASPATVVTARGADEPTSTFSSSVWTPPRPRCIDPEKP